MKLHIVLFSELLLGGGGCESWLFKFLFSSDNLLKIYSEIHVYGIRLRKYDNKLISDCIFHKDIHFHFCNLENLTLFKRLFFFFKSLFKLFDIYSSHRDHFVAVGSFYEMLAIYLYRRHDVKKIVWLRTILVEHLKGRKAKYLLPVISWVESFCLKRMDCIIANGNDTKKYYQNRCNINSIITIPNAVVVDFVQENKKFFERQFISIGFVGRLYSAKGFDAFVQSVKLFNLAPVSGIRFVIIGSGDMADEAIALDKEYDNCSYVGNVSNNEIFDYLSKLDVTLHLNYSDTGSGVSNSLLESIFSNNLIMCWANIIFYQVVSDRSSFMIKEGDIKSLVDGYKRLAANRTWAKEKVKYASRVKEQYDFNRHVNLFLDTVKLL